MNIDGAFPSNYLKASDIPDGNVLNLRMDRVELEKFDDGPKPILYFQGKEKGLVLNLTNAAVIKGEYGTETSNWAGQPIMLVSTTTMFKGKEVPCLRVRAPVKAQPAAQPTPHLEEPARVKEAPPEYNDDEIPF